MKRRLGTFLLTLLLILALAPAALAAGDKRAVRVAVIDTGVSSAVLNAANLAPGKNYIFPGQSTQDRHGHGTAVSAIIAGSKSAGIEGICPEAVIVPLVWTSRNEDGSLVQGNAAMTAQAIRDAIDLYGCRIINLSAGSANNHPDLWEAADYAEEKGALIVSSAGNDGTDKTYYPGAYRTVLCVGSCNAEGTACSTFSNTHDRVDLLARGENLRVASLRSGATTLVSGTSFATAFVSGAAAQLWTKYPELTVEQVREAVLSATRTVDGWKVFDLDAALAWTPNKAPVFSDVAKTDWFRDSVQWAVEEGITAGTSATTFSPGRTCTYGEILTFLWKSQGSPKPNVANHYRSPAVGQGQYYDAPFLWAWETGVVTDPELDPGGHCSRSDVVTFLWRLAGEPDAGQSAFLDVAAGAPYRRAVDWAVANGVTAGTSATTFSPGMTCTRAQIVTFLYHCFTA